MSIARAYEMVGDEYYDVHRHPTCANFRSGSLHLTRSFLRSQKMRTGMWLDVGCGASLLAELCGETVHPLQETILVDAAWTMLEHSVRWVHAGSLAAIAEADALPLRDASITLAIASLADPFNTESFWAELSRVVSPRGAVLFTTPAEEWATTFRANGERDGAEFLLKDGRVSVMPSFIFPQPDQIRLMEKHGFLCESVDIVRLSDYREEQLSPKLLVDGPDLPIVTGYQLVRRAA